MILTALMAHQRKLIRQAVAAKLLAANTAAGTRVQTTRVEPYRKGQLPAIAVYTPNDDTDLEESEETEPIVLTRDLHLEIAGFVAHSDTYSADDAMDDLAEQIEAAMAADYYINATVADQILESTVMEVQQEENRGDHIGIVVLAYKITFRTTPLEAAGQDLPDFTTVDARYPFAAGGVSGELAISAVDSATDQITIAAHGLATGAGPGVLLARDGGEVPGGVIPTGAYWAIVVDANTIKLANSSADALAGIAVDITDDGSGALFFQLGVPEDTFTTT